MCSVTHIVIFFRSNMYNYILNVNHQSRTCTCIMYTDYWMRVFQTISDCSSHVEYKQIIIEKQKYSPLTVNCNNIQLNPSNILTCASNLCPKQGAGDVQSCARFIKIEPSSRLRDGGGGTMLSSYPLHGPIAPIGNQWHVLNLSFKGSVQRKLRWV